MFNSVKLYDLSLQKKTIMIKRKKKVLTNEKQEDRKEK